MNEKRQIILSDKIYNLIITYKKIKNLYARVDDDLNISISCNKYYTIKKIENFVIENEEKIIKMYIAKQKVIEKNQYFYFLKKPYTLCINSQVDKYLFDDDNNILYIKNKNSLLNLVNSKLKSYLDEIMPYIEEDIPEFKVKIRNMKSKWGVCNRANNTITLNLNLIGCTPDFIRYVIIHEICHFTVFNHSKDFYLLVKKYIPNYKEIIKDNKEW